MNGSCTSSLFFSLCVIHFFLTLGAWRFPIISSLMNAIEIQFHWHLWCELDAFSSHSLMLPPAQKKTRMKSKKNSYNNVFEFLLLLLLLLGIFTIIITFHFPSLLDQCVRFCWTNAPIRSLLFCLHWILIGEIAFERVVCAQRKMRAFFFFLLIQHFSFDQPQYKQQQSGAMSPRFN